MNGMKKENEVTNLKQQLEAFDEGIFLDSEGKQSWCFCFWDWFCRDTSLKSKSEKLFKATKTFVRNMDIDTEDYYVFFKNNCPVAYSLYDDFRICDIKTGDVIWTVTPRRVVNDKTICEVWGRLNDFKEPIYEGPNLRDFYNKQNALLKLVKHE
jgi:hypothetical protein